MKNNFLITAILISGIALFSFRQTGDKPEGFDTNNSGQQIQEHSKRQLNANNISAWYRNNGSFNRNPSTGLAGFEWTNGSGNTARFCSGIWMGCKSANDTLTAVAYYSYDYRPGYVDNNGLPQGEDDPLYRIYSITNGDTTSPDYQNWPVSQGAYVTPDGRPYFLGTQTMFYSYTDAYPHQTGITSSQSLKAQILQTNWCYAKQELRDVQFMEFKIINRSTEEWVNLYINIWSEDDIGSGLNDAIGCDTLRNLGYMYKLVNNDPMYGNAPPAVGFVVLRSPIVYTGNLNDTVKYYDPPGSQNLRVKAGFEYTGMNTFNTSTYGQTPPAWPFNNGETYRVLSGKMADNSSWINPVTGQQTTRIYSGDPVSGTGWIMNEGGDEKFSLGCGPFNMSPNDTQSIIVAQVIARGSDNINSISQLRNLTDYTQNVYNANFQDALSVHSVSSEIPESFSLSQNYPNPFNPSTVIRYSLTSGQHTSLKVFDAMGREVSTLVNELQKAGTYEVSFDGSGLSSGIYFYTLSVNGFTETKRMILLK